MTLSAGQKKLLHTIIGGVGAAAGYWLVSVIPIGQDLKVPVLGLCVATLIRVAGALLSKVETEPPGPQT